MTPTNGSQPTSPRARCRAGQRWSANSTVEWLDANGRTIIRTPNAADAPRHATKARVHYRVDGSSKKPTFVLGDRTFAALTLEISTFQATLAAAHAANWLVGPKGRPLPPLPAPSTHTADTSETPGGITGGTTGETEVDASTTPGNLGPLPSISQVGHTESGAQAGQVTATGRFADVTVLVEWISQRHRSTFKRRGGTKRAKKTLADYTSALSFFSEYARYAGDDPRCADPRIEPGQPWLIDPIVGASETDLLRLLDLRANVNLRTRSSNDAKMRAWANSGGTLEMPVLLEEVTGARTVEAFARTVREMFEDAFTHELITYLPWTAAVTEAVPYAGRIRYTKRTVASPTLITKIAETIGTVQLTARTCEGTRATCDGGRYSAMVWVAGRMGLRPEETIALRDDWVILDGPDPRLVLHWAEVFEPGENGAKRQRRRVPLKHREAGEVRVVRPDATERNEFIRVMRAHRDTYVTTDSTPDEDGGYVFTNHGGDPVELSNFGRWWTAALDAVPDPDRSPLLNQLPFRRLRAAAITNWLTAHGLTTEQAATKAGNTQAVIETHYKGVLDSRESPSIAAACATTHGAGLTGLLATLQAKDLEELTGAELGALTDLVRAANASRTL